jgi:hypothetical protein
VCKYLTEKHLFQFVNDIFDYPFKTHALYYWSTNNVEYDVAIDERHIFILLDYNTPTNDEKTRIASDHQYQCVPVAAYDVYHNINDWQNSLRAKVTNLSILLT